MYLISSEGYKNVGVHILIIRKTEKIWVSMKNVHNSLGVKNISDLILKEIYGIYETKNLTKKQVFENYTNLSEEKLSEKSNKNVYVKNNVMATVIKRCKGGGKIKKEAKEK